MGNGWLNGGLDSFVATAKRLWGVGVFLMGVVVWVFVVNQTVADTKEIKKNVSVIPTMNRYMRDSLTTDADSKFVLAQTLASFRRMENRLRRMEGRPQQEGLGRWEYFEQYGPIPQKYRDWYEPAPSQWLQKKAGGR